MIMAKPAPIEFGTVKCPLCGDEGSHTVPFGASWEFLGERYRYLQCAHCNLVFADPFPGEAVLKEVYQHAYAYSYAARFNKLKRMQAYHRAWRLRRIIPRGAKVLDYGCGHGYLVKALRHFGYDAYGFDIGFRPGTFEDSMHCYYGNDLSAVPENQFDAVACFHVLEHVRDARTVLAQISERLVDLGLCIVAVPNFDSFGQKLRGSSWVWLQEPYIHLIHFNSKNIRRVVDKFPGTIKKIWTADRWDGSIYFGFVRPALNRILAWLNTGKDIDHFHAMDEWMSIPGAAVSYALNPIHYLLNSGSELMIVLSKERSKSIPIGAAHQQ